jgi:hypothetical protein
VSTPAHATSLHAILRGDSAVWKSSGLSQDEFFDACAADDGSALFYHHLNGASTGERCPDELRRQLSQAAHASAAIEAVRTREIVTVLDALGAGGIQPILIKGTPLGHTVYPSPAMRSHEDTDLMIRRAQIDDVRSCMSALGYTKPLLSDGELLFCQFQMMRRDRFGVHHAFDFHWKISTQSMFADLLSYDELATDAVPVTALGNSAHTAGRVHSLLLACVHPVMHHRNRERLVWLLDIHLLVSRLPEHELERFVVLAIDRKIAAICAHQMALSRARFGTAISDAIIARLAARERMEPSTAYLRPSRRWHNELASNVRGLTRLSDRLRLLREVLLPGRRYMLAAYGLGAGAFPLLPALYLHRCVSGLWRVLVGRK